MSESSENDRDFVNKMTSSLMTGPKVIDTDTWARRSRISFTFENDNAFDLSAFAAVHRNRSSNHSNFFLKSDFWDSFYVDENDLLQSGWKKKWDRFYLDENDVTQNVEKKKWDRFYVDRNDVIRNVWNEEWDELHDNASAATKNDSSHRRDFARVLTNALSSFTQAFESARDVEENE